MTDRDDDKELLRMEDNARRPLSSAIWPADRFASRDIPPRPWLVEGVIPHPSVGLEYAWRGSGKTLVAMHLALAVARGTEWLGYKVPRARTVLYIDGEMPLPDMRARLVAQSGAAGAPSNLFILASEDLALMHRNINLASASDRTEIFDPYADCLVKELIFRTREDLGLIIFDNWTTLVRGIDENDNSQMDPLKEWLILLRHFDTSVLFVHHSGKSGGQRGGSAREDIIDYSFSLKGSNGPEVFTWDKARTGRPDPDTFGLRLDKDEKTGYLEIVRSNRVSVMGPEPKHDEDVIKWLRENGPATPAEIAEATEIPRSTVYRSLNRHLRLEIVTKLADGKYCT